MGSGRKNADEMKFGGIAFEWHAAKAAANLKKHRVSFEEAMAIFADEMALTVPDMAHSGSEDRSLGIGRSERGRLLTVCFTERRDRIRIISARLAERWERREYERGDEKQ
jgi:uncharacterized protein